MYNKTFKKNVYYSIIDTETGEIKITEIKTQRECKEYIYSKCNRNQDYEIIEYYEEKGRIVITNKWIYRFKKEGPIFTKKIYNRLKEIKIWEERRQLKLFIDY